MAEVAVAEQELRLKANQAIQEMNKLTQAASGYSAQLKDILKYLDDINNKPLNKIKKQTNNYDLSSAPHVAVGHAGTIASKSGRDKKFLDYEQAIIDGTTAQTELTNEIKADTAERKKYRKQRADAETQRAQNDALRAAKAEDKTSATYLSNQSKIAEAKLLNAKANQAGALKRNWKYQTAGAIGTLGEKISQTGSLGRVVGGIVDILGKSLISPAAAGRAALEQLGNAIIDIGKSSVKAYTEIEATKTQLGVVFSSKTQADSMFGDISKYAVKSPFGIQQTSELAVLLKQSGVYASDLMDTLKMLGDTAGGNMEKMKRIANNYAQIMAIGKASMLDMRQFAYAGIPIFEAVSKELGVSQQELRKLISDGKVTSDIIEKVFKDLTGINGIFENATEQGAKTLKARLQNLSDAKQLAFGSIGEWGVNLGTRTGNDSLVNKLVTLMEDAYSYLQQNVSTTNIEKDVSKIATREKDIEKYQNLIDFAKSINSKTLETAFTQKLEKLIAKQNRDEERSTYVKSYNNKTRGFDLLRENNITGTVSSIQSEIDSIYNEINELNVNYWKKQAFGEGGFTDRLNYTSDHNLIVSILKYFDAKNGSTWVDASADSEEGLQVEALKERAQLLQEILNALGDYKDISEKLIIAMKEDSVLKAQELSVSSTNKSAESSTSLNTSFNELASILESSKEYQEKEEAKKLEILKKAQEELKLIAQHTDTNGSLRFNEYSRQEFQRLKNAGAFTARQLNIVEGKNASQLSQDRAQLESQFANASGKILDELLKSPEMANGIVREGAKAFENSFMSLANATSDKDFFDKFGVVLYDMSKDLEEISKVSSNKEWVEELKNYLIESTNAYEARTKGVDADLNEQLKKGKEKPDFIPLWKRIIEGATGFSAERISTSKNFMEEYQKYAAMQVSRSGLQGLVNAGGRNGEIDALMAYSDKTNKQGVKQIDWIKTEENLYKYALSMETPLKKASATMSGLADGLKSQVDTYKKLTVDMRTVGEDWSTINNDIKGQYSVAQGLGNANILDNAFQATAGETKRFKVQFDEKQGLVVFDKQAEKIVGAIDELKENKENLKDDELKKYLEENVKIDNLVLALDKAAVATELNSNIVSTNAKLLEEANSLAQERIDKSIDTFGKSSAIIGVLKKDFGIRNTASLTTRNESSAGYEASLKIESAISKTLNDIAKHDSFSLGLKKGDEKLLGNDVAKIESLNALIELQKTLKGNDVDKFSKALAYFIEQFPDAVNRIVDEATKTAESNQKNEILSLADNALRKAPLSIEDAFKEYIWPEGTFNPFEFNIMKDLGNPYVGFSDFSEQMTKLVMGNPSDNRDIFNKYKDNIYDAIHDKKNGLDIDQRNEIQIALNNNDLEAVQKKLEEIGKSNVWDEATDGANKWALSLGKIGTTLSDIAKNTKDLAMNFASDLVTSSFETWGEALAKGDDASEDLAKNLANMAAGLLKNMGSMITQAGLALAISSIGNPAGVYAGLAIAAAGGALSFAGGFLQGAMEDNNKNETDKEYQKLLQIKQDLTDLLKQAREDAIYYENTVRHKKAISANDELTQRSVHDAIITPRGDIVTTDPKDYLIATKTPKSLIGGGAPTINFSVIDKSTGIKVTQQRSTYNKDTNSIDFEAIIESKVQEVIATEKGDEAFGMREARLRGRSVIA